jgi:uncharacterized protein
VTPVRHTGFTWLAAWCREPRGRGHPAASVDLKQRDFDYTILQVQAHRPWPMPSSPWVMTQCWHDLLFAHWRVERDQLRALVPPVLELDTFDGESWVGVVPFFMTNVAPRGLPALPWLSAFAELNVRTYVRHRGRSGVYFFSLDAANPVAVRVARRLFHLPYFTAAMTVAERPDGHIAYDSRRTDRRGTDARLIATYGPSGAASPPQPGTLEHFLTERYCLFTADRRGRPYSVDIHHPPWPLQPAEAEIRTNTMAAGSGLVLATAEPLLHFSRRQDIVAWRLRTE